MRRKNLSQAEKEASAINPRRESNTAKRKGKDYEQLGADEQEEAGGKEGNFFACYLLTSLCPRFKGRTYIGFTVNPQRRIRQHNGELRSGAFRTKSKRPWEMVLCIYGFPTNVAALQFEWAWQHPVESLAVRQAAAAFKSLSGVGNKIKLAYTMLTLPSWQSLNLTVNFFSTKYKNHTAGCPSLPEHMRVQVCSMDELPCYSENGWDQHEIDEWDIEDECDVGRAEEKPSSGDNNPFLAVSTSSQANSEESYSRRTNCAEGSNLEQYGTTDKMAMRSLRSSSYVDEEDHTQNLNSSPAGASSCSSLLNVVGAFDDSNNFTSVDSKSELDQSCRNHSPSRVGTNAGKHLNRSSSISCEVEIIDLYTPSPCQTTNNGSKKRRRRSIVYPEIIDLTEDSPMAV